MRATQGSDGAWRAAAGLLESASLTRGPRLSAAERERRRRSGPRVRNGPAERVGPAWRRKRKEGEGRERFWAGLERKKEEEKVFHFLKDPNTFSLNSNSRIQIQVEQQAIK